MKFNIKAHCFLPPKHLHLFFVDGLRQGEDTAYRHLRVENGAGILSAHKSTFFATHLDDYFTVNMCNIYRIICKETFRRRAVYTGG